MTLRPYLLALAFAITYLALWFGGDRRSYCDDIHLQRFEGVHCGNQKPRLEGLR